MTTPAFAPTSAASLRMAYERNASQILQAVWRYSWWCHGGEPGPHWRSDRLELGSNGVAVAAQFVETRNGPTPPFASQAQEFTGFVPRPQVEQLLQASFSTGFFERHLPAQGRSSLADALIHEIAWELGDLRLAKTLYEPASDELGPLGLAFQALIAELRHSGARRDIATQAP